MRILETLEQFITVDWQEMLDPESWEEAVLATILSLKSVAKMSLANHLSIHVICSLGLGGHVQLSSHNSFSHNFFLNAAAATVYAAVSTLLLTTAFFAALPYFTGIHLYKMFKGVYSS